MKSKEYAEAIFEASKGKDDGAVDFIVSNVKKVLEKNGHVKLFPAIVRELEKIIKRREVSDSVIVVLSNKNNFDDYSASIDNDIKSLNASGLPIIIKEDNTLIGGYQIYTNGIRVDNTHKKVLLSMYTKLITN